VRLARNVTSAFNQLKHALVGLSLPGGVRLVTWTVLACHQVVF
jgi:hypothetical protein